MRAAPAPRRPCRCRPLARLPDRGPRAMIAAPRRRAGTGAHPALGIGRGHAGSGAAHARPLDRGDRPPGRGPGHFSRRPRAENARAIAVPVEVADFRPPPRGLLCKEAPPTARARQNGPARTTRPAPTGPRGNAGVPARPAVTPGDGRRGGPGPCRAHRPAGPRECARPAGHAGAKRPRGPQPRGGAGPSPRRKIRARPANS